MSEVSRMHIELERTVNPFMMLL